MTRKVVLRGDTGRKTGRRSVRFADEVTNRSLVRVVPSRLTLPNAVAMFTTRDRHATTVYLFRRERQGEAKPSRGSQPRDGGGVPPVGGEPQVVIQRQTLDLDELPDFILAPDVYRNRIVSRLSGRDREDFVASSFSNDESVASQERLVWPCAMVRDTYMRNTLDEDGLTNVRSKEDSVRFFLLVSERGSGRGAGAGTRKRVRSPPLLRP